MRALYLLCFVHWLCDLWTKYIACWTNGQSHHGLLAIIWIQLKLQFGLTGIQIRHSLCWDGFGTQAIFINEHIDVAQVFVQNDISRVNFVGRLLRLWFPLFFRWGGGSKQREWCNSLSQIFTNTHKCMARISTGRRQPVPSPTELQARQALLYLYYF